MTDVQNLKALHKDTLMADANVSSVGIGMDDEGEEVLVIGVKDASQSIQIPESLSDSDYRVDEIGELKPEIVGTQVVPEGDPTAKHRPVPGGVSVGHIDITAGTASYLLEDGSGTVYTASNNHVYAMSNQATEGDTIIQPGSADGGTTSDQSATLVGYVPIENGVTVDLAWAAQEVEHVTQLLDYAVPQGTPRRVEVGDVLKKSGRTTGVTEGEVQQVQATVDVNYGGDLGTVTLEDQILTGDMSDGGDSGSAALIKGEGVPGGLLFAGSDTVTVLSEAVNVEAQSGMSIVTGEAVPTATVTLVVAEQTTNNKGNITATVEDQNGNPVTSVTVTADGEGASLSQTTDASGVATFEGVTVGSYTVATNPDGYDGDSASITSDDFQ